jgi:hydrogenase nickel incorporation protein HypA/HybF
MHELSLASSLIEVVREEAARHDLERVERIRLRVGALRAVVPELLESCMGMVCQGTIAEGAAFEIEEVPALVRCSGCGREFSVDSYLYTCPGCSELGGEVLQGEELALIEIEGD